MKRRAILIAIVLMLVALGFGYRFVAYRLRPITVSVPRAPESPLGNVFPQYLALAERTQRLFKESFEMREAVRRLRRGGDLRDPKLEAILLERIAPIRKKCLKLVDQPCVPLDAYTSLGRDSTYIESFRTWVLIEQMLLEAALERGEYQRAEVAFRTATLMAEQVRQKQGTLHYFASNAMRSSICRPIWERFSSLPSIECKRFAKCLREMLKRRTSVADAIQADEYEHINTILDLRAMATESFLQTVNNVRLAYADTIDEAHSLYQAVRTELLKPFNLQSQLPTPTEAKHQLNQILFSSFDTVASSEARVQARLQLLWLALELRSFHADKGRYPAKLDELGTDYKPKDPYTGGDFVYKTGPKGFLLYSVGPNGKDENGRRSPENFLKEADLGVLPLEGKRRHEIGEPLWIR